MKYAEDCETDDESVFRFAIYVYEDGTAKISSFASFDPFDENVELTNDFFEILDKKSEAFEYTFDKNIMVSTYIDKETVEDFGENFSDIIFNATKDELCRCRIATILLVDREVEFEEALSIALGIAETDAEFDPADFMYWFEHRVLVNNFVEGPKDFIQRCLGKMETSNELFEEVDVTDIPGGMIDNYVYRLFSLLTMKENIRHDFSVEDFIISEKSINSRYNLLSITLPEPIRDRLCYKMEVVYEEGNEDEARIFTIERGEENTTFLCNWVIRGDKRTHLNYNLVPKDTNKYTEILMKIYEGSIKEMITYTPDNEDDSV